MPSLPDRALTGLFLLVLFLPMSLAGLSRETTPSRLEEKRPLADMPAFPLALDAVKAFPVRFEAYCNDHFQLREVLIRGHNLLKIKLLKRSPRKDVLMGRDGWLFFTGNNLLEDFLAMDPFTEDELNALQRLLEAKRDWLAVQGIPYVFVVVPNKQSIYPEQMPETYYRSHGPSRLDQLLDHMRARSDVGIVDVRGRLRKAKPRHEVYFRTDTHWNEKGAFIAYRRIMGALGRTVNDGNLTPRTFQDYRMAAATRSGGDLANLLGIANDIEESYERLDPLFTRCAREVALPGYLNRGWKPFPEPVAYSCPLARLRLVMFYDSFGQWTQPFLAEHFRKSVFVWRHNLPGDDFKAVVLLEKPDIVVEEIAERFVYDMKNDPEFLP